MDRRLMDVFAPVMRAELSSDGRALRPDAQGLRIAERLIDDAADTHADEIIKLMKPFCRPFDVATVRERLQEMGRRQRRARRALKRDPGAELPLRA